MKELKKIIRESIQETILQEMTDAEAIERGLAPWDGHTPYTDRKQGKQPIFKHGISEELWDKAIPKLQKLQQTGNFKPRSFTYNDNYFEQVEEPIKDLLPAIENDQSSREEIAKLVYAVLQTYSPIERGLERDLESIEFRLNPPKFGRD